MCRRFAWAVLIILFTLSLSAFAKGKHGDNDRVSFGSDITVSEGENAGDLVCMFCSVKVHGEVGGDIAVIFGSITVDSGHKISGDVAVIGGDLNLGEEAVTGGDVAVVAGNANLAPSATIHGSRTVMPGAFWLLIPFAPLLVLIGVIWLAVYFFRRNRYRYAVYPARYQPPPR